MWFYDSVKTKATINCHIVPMPDILKVSRWIPKRFLRHRRLTLYSTLAIDESPKMRPRWFVKLSGKQSFPSLSTESGVSWCFWCLDVVTVLNKYFWSTRSSSVIFKGIKYHSLLNHIPRINVFTVCASILPSVVHYCSKDTHRKDRLYSPSVISGC